MLTRRQIEIFMEFYSQSGSFIRLQDIATKFEVTTRTIQLDIKVINEIGKENASFQIISYSTKGSKLEIYDAEKTSQFSKTEVNAYNNKYYFSEQGSRVYYILNQVINSKVPVKSDDLATQMYISKSRISNDFTFVKKILQKYNLELVSIPHHGCIVEGTELDKRRCLVQENLGMHDYRSLMEITADDSAIIEEVTALVSPIIFDNEFKISDIAFQNLIIHIVTSITRIKEGFYADDNGYKIDDKYKKVYVIAKEIIEKCAEKYDFEVRYSEIILLTFNLFGKQIFDQPNYISEEINERILDALTTVSSFYNVDFANDLNLRISLALHIVPLEARLITGLTLKNIMAFQIKRSYTYAFDIASAFISIIFAHYFTIISDDEISFVAIHFMMSLNRYNDSHHNVDVLLITSNLTSDTLLITQSLKKRFSQINKIQVASEKSISNEELSKYNVILTTNNNISNKYHFAEYINYFMDESDYQKVEMLINGFRGVKDILNKFNENLFWYGNANSKYEIMRTLFELAQKEFDLSEDYYNSVLVHESYASSWFGNNLAVPHSEKPLTKSTFVAVGILKKPIMWDENCPVQIVFLVSIGNANAQSNQLWYYLADILSDSNILNHIISIPTYQNLIQVINKNYKNSY